MIYYEILEQDHVVARLFGIEVGPHTGAKWRAVWTGKVKGRRAAVAHDGKRVIGCVAFRLHQDILRFCGTWVDPRTAAEGLHQRSGSLCSA